MPIRRNEFESSEPQPIYVVEEFLSSNPDSAYTVEDIIVELAGRRVPLTADEVRGILNYLETGGKVHSKEIHGAMYYMYSRTVGFPTS